MTDQEKAADNSPRSKRRTIVVEMTVEDADLVRKALAEGKLDAYGITAITELSPEQSHPLYKEWVQRRMREQQPDKSVPPRP